MKKILSLFALLMTIVIGAKAADVTADVKSVGTGLSDIGSVTVVNVELEKYQPTSSDKGKNSYSDAVSMNKYVVFSFKPASGDFTPTKLTFDASKIGTGDPNIYVDFFDGEGTKIISGQEVEIKRNSEASDASELKKTFDLTGAAESSGEIIVRIYVGKCANNKQVGLGNVVITGTSSTPVGPTIDVQPQDDEFVMGTTNYPSLSVEATSVEPPIEYQWYYKGATDIEIPGASSATLSLEDYKSIPVVASMMQTPGEYGFYCTLTDGTGSKNTRTATITVRAASTACELISVQFSTGVYGAIADPQPEKQDDPSTDEDESAPAQDGVIEVPYEAGTLYPMLLNNSIEMSENANYNTTDPSKVIVTAEDGVTSATYNIEYVAVNPLEVTDDYSEEFTSVPSWVFNKYGFDEDAKKRLKFAKAVNDDGTGENVRNMRISKGITRQYYFVGPAKSFTLTASTQARDVNVYVNGEFLKKSSSASVGTIYLDVAGSNLIMIESAQTSGDGGFSACAIEAVSGPVVTLNNDGFATFSSTEDVAAEGATVYYASGVQGGYLFLTQTSDNRVAADGGYILVGEPGATVTFSIIPMDIEPEDGNLLYPTTTATASPIEVPTNPTDGSPDALTLDGKVFKTFTGATFNANKAYLVKHEIVDAMGGNTLEIKFAEATGVNGVAEAKAEVAPAKVIKNGQLFIGNYNIAGQQVK